MERNLKVLVADDIEILAKNMSTIISKNERVEQVKYVLNGEEELNEILNFKPDIVFTDMQMPKKTGLEVIKEVMFDTSIEKKPCFVLVTADRDSSYFMKASELGFTLEFKPINPDRINEYIDNFGIEPKEYIELKKEKKGFFSRFFNR